METLPIILMKTRLLKVKKIKDKVIELNVIRENGQVVGFYAIINGKKLKANIRSSDPAHPTPWEILGIKEVKG